MITRPVPAAEAARLDAIDAVMVSDGDRGQIGLERLRHDLLRCEKAVGKGRMKMEIRLRHAVLRSYK